MSRQGITNKFDKMSDNVVQNLKKEKVNTHFPFLSQEDMTANMEHNLILIT